MIDLSVCTPSFNTEKLLKQYLRSLYDNTDGISLEVIVVDNGSTDGSPEMLAKEFPQVNLIRNKGNLGFAKACNQAFAVASGRYVACLNSDVIVLPGAIGTMCSFLDTHVDAAAVSCRLLNEDGSLQHSCSRLPTLRTLAMQAFGVSRLFPGSNLLAGSLMTEWDHSEIRTVDQPAGACLVIRADALRELGGFDERYHVYFEDVDWCYRAKIAGKPIYFVPEAKIVHLRGRTSQLVPDIRIRTRYESQLRFFDKYYKGSRTLIAVRSIIVLGMLYRSVVAILCGIFAPKWRAHARMAVSRYMSVAMMSVRGSW